MPRYHPDAELAPRDVVARAILSEMLAEGAPSAFLDLRRLPQHEVHERFPTIADACRRYGLDLAHDLIPVAPAAHYFMGGVAVDTWGAHHIAASTPSARSPVPACMARTGSPATRCWKGWSLAAAPRATRGGPARADWPRAPRFLAT